MSNAKKKRVSLRGSKGTIQRVLKLIQPYRGLVLFTLLLAAVTVLTTLYAPILSGRGVDLIVGQGNVNFPALGKIAIQFGVTVCVTSICQWLMNMVNNRITFQVVRDIRVQAFQHMEILPLSYMDAHKPGDAISRINTDVEQFSDGLLMGFTQLFTGILTIVGTLGFMLSIDWRITLIVVVLTPLSIFVAKFIAEHTYDMFRVQSETRAELTGLVDELIGNEHLVRAFGYESRAEERFDKINADLQICVDLVKALLGAAFVTEGADKMLVADQLVHQTGQLGAGLALYAEHIIGMLRNELCHKDGKRGENHNDQGNAPVNGKHKAQSAHNGQNAGEQLGKAHQQAVTELLHIGVDAADGVAGLVGIHIAQG